MEGHAVSRCLAKDTIRRKLAGLSSLVPAHTAFWNAYASLFEGNSTVSEHTKVAHGAYPGCELRVDSLENIL